MTESVEGVYSVGRTNYGRKELTMGRKWKGRNMIAGTVLFLLAFCVSETVAAQEASPVLVPLFRVHARVLATDYFLQFVSGDDEFVSTIFGSHTLSSTDLREGQALSYRVIETYGEEVIRDQMVETALLEEMPDGSAWWSLSWNDRSGSYYVEYRISSLGVPEEVRYTDPASQDIVRRLPPIAEQAREFVSQQGEESIRLALKEELERGVVDLQQNLFPRVNTVGTEFLDTPLGRVSARHLADDSPAGQTDLWVSKEVPEEVVKYSLKGSAHDMTVTIAGVREGASRTLPEGRLVYPEGAYDGGGAPDAEDGYISLGSVSAPVAVESGDFTEGTAAPGETSYYSLTARRRADVYVEVEELSGDVELYDYAGDAAFADWVTGSSGGNPTLEEYFMEAGDTVYFTVSDVSGSGARFTINLREDPILDPLGVQLKGDIRSQAVPLVPGVLYRGTPGEKALRYYQVKAPRSGTLRIETRSLPESMEVMWYGVDDDLYAGMTGWQENGVDIMEISGVHAGAVCRFYVVGPPGEPDPAARFVINISYSK